MKIEELLQKAEKRIESQTYSNYLENIIDFSLPKDIMSFYDLKKLIPEIDLFSIKERIPLEERPPDSSNCFYIQNFIINPKIKNKYRLKVLFDFYDFFTDYKRTMKLCIIIKYLDIFYQYFKGKNIILYESLFLRIKYVKEFLIELFKKSKEDKTNKYAFIANTYFVNYTDLLQVLDINIVNKAIEANKIINMLISLAEKIDKVNLYELIISILDMYEKFVGKGIVSVKNNIMKIGIIMMNEQKRENKRKIFDIEMREENE